MVLEATASYPGASILLNACEETQLSLVWRENNLLCKGRLDVLSSELKTIIDLKTCQDASREAFSRKIADLGYHRQGCDVSTWSILPRNRREKLRHHRRGIRAAVRSGAVHADGES